MRSVKMFFAFTLAAVMISPVFAADSQLKEIPAPKTGSAVSAGKAEIKKAGPKTAAAKDKSKAVKNEIKTVKEDRQQAAKKADKTEKKAEETKLSAEQVLSKLEAWDKKLDSLDIKFIQTVFFKEADIKQSIEGSMQYLKPNFLRLEHTAPAKQIVTTDKKDILIYKPADRQAIRATWDGWVKTQNQTFYGILDFGNYSSLSKNNNVSLEGGEKGKPYVLIFTPKEGTAYKLALTLSEKDFFPAEAELSVGSAVTSTKLTKVRKNITIDKEIFEQKLPEKTEIINF